MALQSSLPDTIERSLSTRFCCPEAELDVDHLLSRVPYRSMLENLFVPFCRAVSWFAC